ncbi:proline/glycine betaine ABC transporter permease [Mesorhizobium sp.]|uniref:ABC transporter permease n=1 Tax=Mesorhizobium sp. TaxID=1871066 RepID=UPI0025EA634B|nr:ABC transporter permease subunit [Mesorhizobium sp.]
MADCTILDPFKCYSFSAAKWIESASTGIIDAMRPMALSLRQPVDYFLNLVNIGLHACPPTILILGLCAIAAKLGGLRLAGVVLFCLGVIGFLGVWAEAMTTLSVVLVAVLICVAFGIPIGIAAARNDSVSAILKPVLDGMQTIPAFVYLVPIVMIFGVGNVPGVLVTVIFAISPVIRLTNLGIRQVPREIVEAMEAFGASSSQTLFKAQIPLAAATIMAGVNQTLMMALSMVVIGSMISVGGLGLVVLRGIGQLDVGTAAVGGVGIVLLAVMLDRLTHAVAAPTREAAVKRREASRARPQKPILKSSAELQSTLGGDK